MPLGAESRLRRSVTAAREVVHLDARPSPTRISQAWPAPEHDALNRLPRPVPLSTWALLAGPRVVVAGLSRALGTPGHLVGDTAYTGGCASKAEGRLALVWVHTLPSPVAW